HPSYIINLFWLFYNLYLLIMAIFFASERPKYRKSERLTISTFASISVHGKNYWGITEDISENGVSILFEEPFYVDPEDHYPLTIKTERYHAECKAKIIRVDNYLHMYKYSFNFSVDEPNYQQMLGVIYDRVPETPKVTTHDSMLENLDKNLVQRLKAHPAMNRKLPRISVGREVEAYFENNYVMIYMEDFNYNYCSVRSDIQYPNLKIPLGEDGVLLDCALKKELSSESHCVYYVTNYKDLVDIDIKFLEKSKPALMA
ncbi:MAG: PilZ domain-containing protein, partial [Bacillota bacterium]|nr:PilZ domain-containing protein [Bacillota bacterium]